MKQGGIFAFGTSEKQHGADLYSNRMKLHAKEDGTYLGTGSKYYIGNANEAALVSVFGRIHETFKKWDVKRGQVIATCLSF